MSSIGRRMMRARQQKSGLGLEMLESRVMLSTAVTGALAIGGGSGVPGLHAAATAAPKYDLVPSVTAVPKLTGALVAGQPITGTLAVTIRNKGTAASPAGLQVSAYLKPAAGGANIALLATNAKPTTVGSVAVGNTATATLNLSVPATVPAGTYSVVVTADPTNTFHEANNSVVVPFQLKLAAGFISLTASITGSTLPTSIVAGTATKGGTLSVSVSNLGNIPTTLVPSVNVVVILRPVSGGADVTIFRQNGLTLSTLLAAVGGKTSGKDTLAVAVPAGTAAQTSELPAGSYKVIVTVAAVSSKLKVPALTITGPTIAVTAAKTTAGAVLKHGDTVTFTASTQLTGGNFLELGTFVTNTGATGSYRFAPAGLSLTYDSGGVDADTFTFTAGQVFLDPVLNGVGKKVVFSFSSVGAIMHFSDPGGTGAYAKYA